ncbi:hypothetical protein [Bradyrhizobium sp. 33ap4]|uniref:hypothetical protein n=1 Tax=Bradyrhizobium sp. 33ap4 TaxID=3061630 RepID=UPI002930D04F|nr:hypothetical protein [Bradyrhizobium sp. 33ap4]
MDSEYIRLMEVIAWQTNNTLGENRRGAVNRRRNTSHRTAREKVAELVDLNSIVEYVSLAIAQRQRPLETLIKYTPADGLVAGVERQRRSLRLGSHPLHGRRSILVSPGTVVRGSCIHDRQKASCLRSRDSRVAQLICRGVSAWLEK